MISNHISKILGWISAALFISLLVGLIIAFLNPVVMNDGNNHPIWLLAIVFCTLILSACISTVAIEKKIKAGIICLLVLLFLILLLGLFILTVKESKISKDLAKSWLLWIKAFSGALTLGIMVLISKLSKCK